MLCKARFVLACTEKASIQRKNLLLKATANHFKPRTKQYYAVWTVVSNRDRVNIFNRPPLKLHHMVTQRNGDSADTVRFCLLIQFRLVPDPSTSDLSVSSMRPDEHKKKQRADYKKKHGISNKKTTSKEKTETAKTVNPTETQGGDGLADTSQVRSSRVFDRLQNQS